jgi:hypothetical protein
VLVWSLSLLLQLQLMGSDGSWLRSPRDVRDDRGVKERVVRLLESAFVFVGI